MKMTAGNHLFLKNSLGEVFLWISTSSRTAFLLLIFMLSLLSCNFFTWEDVTEGALKTFPWMCCVQERSFSMKDLANECCQREMGQEDSNPSITRISKTGTQGICSLAWPRKGRCVDTCELLTQTHTAHQYKTAVQINKNTSHSNILELNSKAIVKSHWLQAKHTFTCSA